MKSIWMTKDTTVIPMPKQNKTKPKQSYLDKIIKQELKRPSPTSILKDFLL